MSIILNVNSSFAVLIPFGSADAEYINRAKRYAAVGLVGVLAHKEDKILITQKETGSLVAYQGRQAILTSADFFTKNPEKKRVWIDDKNQLWEINRYVVHPKYLEIKNAPSSHEWGLVGVNIALGFLEKKVEGVAPLSLGIMSCLTSQKAA